MSIWKKGSLVLAGVGGSIGALKPLVWTASDSSGLDQPNVLGFYDSNNVLSSGRGLEDAGEQVSNVENFSSNGETTQDSLGGGVKSEVEPAEYVWEPTFQVSQEEIEAERLRKERVKVESKRVFDSLNDYTFRLFGPCGMGTGWILDYAIPEGQDKYPTTWYIATNSHVIGSFRFPRNHYDTVLPRDDEQTRKLKSSNIRRDYSNLSLGGGLPCRLVDQVGYLDMSLAHAETAQKNQDNYGFVYRKKMYEPRLFWTAINYLEKSAESGVDYDHFSDFSVLELEFTSEQAAREATRNFADKYKVGTKGGINLFDKPLEAKYSKSELYDMNDNFYLLAYAGGAKDRWSYTTNLNEETGIASQLAGNSWDWMYVDQEKKRYRGFVEAKQVFKQGFGWGGKTYKEVGHFYKLKYNPLRPGSSGGVFVDKNGSAIGLTGAVEIGPKAVSSWVTPLRSEGVTVEEAGVKTPKYDLIVGVEGQKSSYRQQVEKFNKKTWLSSKGWKN